MKKGFKIFVLLTFVFLLVSCDQDNPMNNPDAPYYDPYTPSKEKLNELMSFFNSHSYDIICETRGKEKLIEAFEFNVREDRIRFQKLDEVDDQRNYPYIFNSISNYLYCDFGERASYTNISNTVDFSKIDIEEYIWNIKEVDGNLVFSIKMDSYLKDLNVKFTDYVYYDYYEIINVVFENDKIVELNYEVDWYKVIIKINGYIYSGNDTSDLTILKNIEFPSVDECVYITEDQFQQFLDGGPSGIIDEYELVVEYHNFTVKDGKITVSNVEGGIYDKITNVRVDYIHNLKYSKEDVFSSEDYVFTVSMECFDRVFSTEIQAVAVYDTDIESRIIHEDLSKIYYGFDLDNFVYLCDERYLYKFDEKCVNLIGKIDLQSIAKSHYFKDDYLYVASYLPYETKYMEDDLFEGYVTQIRIDDFSVEKQVYVKCLPHSIIVDNRNNVILSKGADQFVYVDQVNMETGELTPLFTSFEEDELIYNLNNDTIILITTTLSSENELYQYDGDDWKMAGDSTIISDIYYSTSEEMLVFSDGVYRYDFDKNDYIFNKFQILKHGFALDYVIIDDNLAYMFRPTAYSDKYSLLIYDLNTKRNVEYYFQIANNIDICFMYKISEDIYCISADGVIYKILI